MPAHISVGFQSMGGLGRCVWELKVVRAVLRVLCLFQAWQAPVGPEGLQGQGCCAGKGGFALPRCSAAVPGFGCEGGTVQTL